MTPDANLYRDYRRVVIALTQINGGFFDNEAIEIGTRLAKDRILGTAAGRFLVAPAHGIAGSATGDVAPEFGAGSVVPGE